MTEGAGDLDCETLVRGLRPVDPQPSPDGRRIAYGVTSGFSTPDARPLRSIWLTDLEGNAEPLTDDSGAAVFPRWSPDGGSLALVSSHGSPGRMTLRLFDLATRETRPLGTLESSIESIRWSPSGDSLLVLAEDVELLGADSDPRVRRSSDPAAPLRRLFRVEVASGETKEVGPDGLTVWEYDWDGERTAVASVSEDPTEGGWYGARLARLDLAERSVTTIYAPDWQISYPRLSPDGDSVVFLEGLSSEHDSLVGTVKLLGVEAGGEPVVIAPELEASSLQWRDASRLWFTARHGMASSCGSLALDGTVQQLWRGQGAFGPQPRLASDSEGRRLVAISESLYDPPEVSVLDVENPETGWRRLTTHGRELAGLPLPEAERFSWTARDGLELEGLLVRPRNGGPAPPLVVFLHGGPTATWSYAFPCGFRHAALLADAGYAVLLSNPRGSTGRGQEFVQAIVGDLGGAELDDHLAAVDACVEARVCDPERVGIIGASHGGFMAAWAVTQTHRFRASIALACVSDYLSVHYTCTIAGLDDVLFTGPDPIADYVAASPVAHARNARTPTLILHGEDDPYCPVSQAEELYGALVAAGVETELVIYPREPHGWIELEHQLDLWRRVRDWFDRHLKDE